MHVPSLRHIRGSTAHVRGRLTISASLGVMVLASFACNASQPTATTPRAVTAAQSGILIRVNQVGFPAAVPKAATVLSQSALASRAFRVVNATGASVLVGSAGADRGAWSSRWRHAYPLDFSALRAPGRYRIVLRERGTVSSPAFE